MSRKTLTILAASLLGILILAFFFSTNLVRTYNIGAFKPTNKPAKSYDEAVARIKEIQKNEDHISDLCKSIFLTHGEKTAKTVLYFHGYTNCAGSYKTVAQELFDNGYNVYVPNLPYHGYKDRMTEDLQKITAEGLAQFASNATNISEGLGDEVTVTGISGGGVLASFIAQTRSDVSKSVPISPVLGYYPPQLPDSLVTNMFLTLPNIFLWWDPRVKEDLPPPYYSYPRYSTHGLGEFVRLGYAVEALAKRNKAKTGEITMISNANDKAIDLPSIYDLTTHWKALKKEIKTYEFPGNLELDHDLMAPNVEKNQQHFYPTYLELLTQE